MRVGLRPGLLPFALFDEALALLDRVVEVGPPPTISIPATMPSKASQIRGLSGCTLTSGQMSIGRSMM